MKNITGSHLLIVSCPEANLSQVVEFLTHKGCRVDDTEADVKDEDTPIEEIFPDRSPGTMLRGLRCREDLTQEEFARRVGISRHRLSRMENHVSPVNERDARKIAKAFNINPRIFFQR